MPNEMFEGIKKKITENVEKIDPEAIKKEIEKTGNAIKDKSIEAKDAAIKMKDDINEKITELDRMLETEITNYNDAFTLMNDKGVQLFVERSRAVDAIDNIQYLINSIANTPKEFEEKFEKIEIQRNQFKDSCAFAEKEVQVAREAAGSAGAGLAAGASVAFMAPTAAMWVATTFGTASTGTAISTLSGAAATNAALAWLGGGALAANGGGMAAGSAFLAMAGPIGWTIAGATLLSSIILFAKKRTKLNAEKNEEIEKVKKNKIKIEEIDASIKSLLDETVKIKAKLNTSFRECFSMYGKDYTGFNEEQKLKLGALVNNTLALSALYEHTLGEE